MYYSCKKYVCNVYFAHIDVADTYIYTAHPKHIRVFFVTLQYGI